MTREDTNVGEQAIARGMLARYRSVAVATEMAHWHAMDHAEDSPERERWQRIRQLIADLDEPKRRSP